MTLADIRKGNHKKARFCPALKLEHCTGAWLALTCFISSSHDSSDSSAQAINDLLMAQDINLLASASSDPASAKCIIKESQVDCGVNESRRSAL